MMDVQASGWGCCVEGDVSSQHGNSETRTESEGRAAGLTPAPAVTEEPGGRKTEI